MKIVELIRIKCSSYGTVGMLLINNNPFCLTLEPRWMQNQKFLSSIPAESYMCERFDSPTHGETFRITNVCGREHIMFHAGNTTEDTSGCVLLGEQWKSGLFRSRAAMKSFMTELEGESVFYLIVREVYR